MSRSRLLSAIALVGVTIPALGGASRSAADVVWGERTQLALISVDRVSSSAPPQETERVWRQANASLQGNRDLNIAWRTPASGAAPARCR